ncbi:FAD/NAD(P)-binding protein [Nocardia takedensis]|uniref:FAD/NAD(P)-binding protein n=1 Tax=Nocardia takedensis TaxID=259390 RepID=UPI0003004B32|nr:FAD/NAD(P)-binding domain-containing protein [Nocardia takedensis]
MGDAEVFRLCIIGLGPRGLSVLERLCANERAAPSFDLLRVHVVDPAAPGAGHVWRSDQSRHLLTNTVACQITVYTDDSARIDGPIEPGPSLYDWAVAITAEPTPDLDRRTLAEAAALGPNSYPTRAFYGSYLRACFDRVLARAPRHVEVVVHASRAVALADTHGRTVGPQGVRLEDGTRLHDLDAVVLTPGHLPVRPTRAEARAASLARIHHLRYLPPGNPADIDLTDIPAGEPVLLRGLGLNFFDYMALLSTGRGGEFHREDGRLVYRACGDEPRLYALSRRGIPYHARGDNEKGVAGRHIPRYLTVEAIRELRDARGAVDFKRDLWPLIAREVESVYYATRLAAQGRAAERPAFLDALDRAASARTGIDRLLAAYGLADRKWDWSLVADPTGGREFQGQSEFRAWILDHLARDVADARRGNLSSPVKAALDVLRDVRNELRYAVDRGALTPRSHAEDLYTWFTPLNSYLSIGPPGDRVEQMGALVEAGVLEVLGPAAVVCVDVRDQRYVAWSPRVADFRVRTGTLIEARLPEPDLRRTADPLLLHLLTTGQCTPFRLESGGVVHETGGLAVTPRPHRVVDATDTPHPRRFAFGIPTESVHWSTAVGIRPGVDSVTLADSDAIARAVTALSPARVDAGAVDPDSVTVAV